MSLNHNQRLLHDSSFINDSACVKMEPAQLEILRQHTLAYDLVDVHQPPDWRIIESTSNSIIETCLIFISRAVLHGD